MNIQIQILISFIVALILSRWGLRMLIKLQHQLFFYDRPKERSSATEPTPSMGGIAIFLSFICVSTLSMVGYELKEIVYLNLGVLMMLVVGIKDDLVATSISKKLLMQVVSALIIIIPGETRLTNLHGLFGIAGIGMIPGTILTCFAIVVIINAFNLTDGIDGLTAGLTLMASLILGVWFFVSGHFNYAILTFTLIGSVAGFFYNNVYSKKLKIFLGDSGSLILGTLMAILVIKFNEFNIDQSQLYAVPVVPAISFALFSYPLFDVLRVMLIRIMNHRSPFQADKNHFHHRLLLFGFSHKKATYTILGANILIIFTVYQLRELGIILLLFHTLSVSILFALITGYIIKQRKLIQKNDPCQQLLVPYFEGIKDDKPDYRIADKKDSLFDSAE